MARPPAKIQEEIRIPGASDAAWLEEVKRRGQEIDAGQVELVPADQVFRKLEASLKK